MTQPTDLNRSPKRRSGEPKNAGTPDRDQIRILFQGEYHPDMHTIAFNSLEEMDLEIIGFHVATYPHLSRLVPTFEVILESDWLTTEQDSPVFAAGMLEEDFRNAGYEIGLLEAKIKFFTGNARFKPVNREKVLP